MSNQFFRPTTLQEGGTYYYLELPGEANEIRPHLVTLLAYDSCPGMVIVCSPEGHTWHCPRERLFVSTACRAGMCMF